MGLDTLARPARTASSRPRGAFSFSEPEWPDFDIAGLEIRLGLPVLYNNDASAAALFFSLLASV